jgi:Ser/Thr protein kinase RdoA (MazF antagonist)
VAEAAKLTIDAPLERLRHLDPFMVPTSGTVVHGDAHLNNVIWNGARVAALCGRLRTDTTERSQASAA